MLMTHGLPALVGGRVCLDFANTVGPRRPSPGEQATDHIPDFRQLARWAVHAGLLPAKRGAALGELAAADPTTASSVMADARRLREAIYEVFAAVADGVQVPQPALDEIQEAYLAALGQARLAPVAAGLDWCWPDPGPDHAQLAQVLWPIARSAVDLALSGHLARIRRCAGDDGHCGWLFLDVSKSGTRRWCSMQTCGSRVKSRRQVERLRAKRSAGA